MSVTCASSCASSLAQTLAHSLRGSIHPSSGVDPRARFTGLARPVLRADDSLRPLRKAIDDAQAPIGRTVVARRESDEDGSRPDRVADSDREPPVLEVELNTD